VIRAGSLRYGIGDFSLDISLEISGDEYFVLLGATGSGKTLFLECLCGLRPLDGGTIEIAGRDVTRADPGRRRIGYVPQDGALFLHLDVRGNIAFSLKVRGMARARIEEKVRGLARLLGIEPLLARRIQSLSGGERQRVALARALACEPALLLLDEPVSALDEFTRDAVCRELAALKRTTGVPVIHVCHSFEEARLVGDRIGIIGDGKIVQVGTADELMTGPADRYVANILRLENIFAGTAVPTAEGSRIDAKGFSLHGPPASGQVDFLVRPWDIRLAASEPKPLPNSTEGRIVELSLAGPLARLKLDGPLPLLVLLPRATAESNGLAEGEVVRVVFDHGAVHVLE